VIRLALRSLFLSALLSTSALAEEHAAGQTTSAPRDTAAPALKPGEHRLHFKVKHQHSREQARARTQYLFDYWKKRFGVVSKWEGDHAVASGNIMGISFTAWVEVTDSSVGGESTDPGFFTRGIAYAYIESKLKKYMHPNYDEP
jgi:Putative polyhydroxyalkanoic acid system protein (PHA_gran_rgn)